MTSHKIAKGMIYITFGGCIGISGSYMICDLGSRVLRKARPKRKCSDPNNIPPPPLFKFPRV